MFSRLDQSSALSPRVIVNGDIERSLARESDLRHDRLQAVGDCHRVFHAALDQHGDGKAKRLLRGLENPVGHLNAVSVQKQGKAEHLASRKNDAW
jgi:hypothetical protein